MALKYQQEIDRLSLSLSCPEGVYPPNGELPAFRLSFNPIEHPLNFLPNVVFDREKNIPFPYTKRLTTNEGKVIVCKRCGASFYLSLESVRKQWENMSDQNKENFGYTHIANGTLNGKDGLMREPEKSGHFGFYEDEKANLTKKFKVSEEL